MFAALLLITVTGVLLFAAMAWLSQLGAGQLARERNESRLAAIEIT